MEMTHAERLILVMLSEVYEHLGIGGRDYIDAKFVRSAIETNQTWGLSWEYPFIFGGKSEAPAIVTEVVAILDMWSFIEEAHERLSADEKKRVKAEADPYGDARFTGFDCHTDTEHIAAARFLIENLGRFTRFKGRNLDSHPLSLAEYQRMYRVFEPIRKTLAGRGLTTNEMIEILKERRNLPRKTSDLIAENPEVSLDLPPDQRVH
jgi:uncharacterized protein YfbU (UPF0304 family)